MLTLAPGCSCDVCAEEYGPHRLPHSIPCGHVLCSSCCTTIVEKTSPRLSPVCPFCRENFSSGSPRLIRMDFTTSGWSTPRRFPPMESFNDTFSTEVLQRKTERLLREGASRSQLEVRRLEDKVARIAAKKCSVEEVSSLYKELEDWLMSEKDDQTSSLFLSAALLRAILMNHLAHSEASKFAKTSEANLKSKIDELEINNGKLETELRRQRTQYTQKSQECQQLRQEVNQLRTLATTLGISSPEMSPRSMSPVPQSTSPTPYSSASAQAPLTPLSRFNPMHSRSASMSSRPSTPATPISPSRSHTPAPTSMPLRSHTPAPMPPRSHTPAPAPPRSHTPGPVSPRSQTPAPGPPRSHTPSLRSQTPSMRSHTPAPPMPPLPRFATPTPMSHRTQTPAPLIPPKPRRLSQPSPPKMMRSASEEKADAHERWIPPALAEGDYDYQSGKYKSSRSSSRTASYSITSRLRDLTH